MSARTYAAVQISIWANPDFRNLDMAAQWAYLALISQKETTNAGTVPLMIRKWSRMCTSVDRDTIETALDTLQAAGFAYWDEDTDEALIRSFIRNDGVYRKPNMLKSAARVAAHIESPKLAAVMGRSYRRCGRYFR